jgi:molecular chaperone DnaK
MLAGDNDRGPVADKEDKDGGVRRFPRITLAAQVRMEFEDIWDLAESETLNISRGGLFVKTSSPRPIGTMLRFEIKVRQGKTFTVEGQVIHHGTEAGSKGIGVSLTSVGEGWVEFVETLEARKRDLADSVDVDLG